MASTSFSIRVAAQRSGLSEHLIRIWERRYAALRPGRSETGRRVFTQEDVERLRLLGQAVKEGHRIGEVATWTDEQLRAQLGVAPGVVSPAGQRSSGVEAELIGELLQAVRAYQASPFDDLLDRSQVLFGGHGALEKVMIPFLRRLGDAWASGELTAAHEHFASERLRGRLLNYSAPFAEAADAPLLISATPSGQLHDLGAALVVAYARHLGWRTLFLGAGLPAAELAGAVHQTKARVLALSLIHPGDDSKLASFLMDLRRYLPLGCALMVGGRSAPAYEESIRASGARMIDTLSALRGLLEEERSRPRPLNRGEASLP